MDAVTSPEIGETAQQLVGVERLGAAILVVFTLGAFWLGTQRFALSLLGGGALSLLNLRAVRVMLRVLLSGSSASAWVVLPLMGKFVLLMALVLVAGSWLKADMLALAIGFSTTILALTLWAIGRALKVAR